MKLAVMQPYLFPYIGYFQLIHAVDVFVIYDDVNYINGGWINRNFIQSRGASLRFTLPLCGASQNKKINDIKVAGTHAKISKTIQQEYAHAPYFKQCFPVIEEILNQDEDNLSRFLIYSLTKTSEYLKINQKWEISSEITKDNNLKGQEKIIDICQQLGATHYINLPGGKKIYDPARFAKEEIKLSFIETRPIKYRQFTQEFLPNLSIIDVLMFNSPETCAQLLNEYTLT